MNERPGPTSAWRTDPSSDSVQEQLARQRDRAERLLNGVRATVLLLLGVTALTYAPLLTASLNRVNILVLAPMLAWTAGQYVLVYRRPRLPGWLAAANPIVDITAVTIILGGYALVADTAALAVRTPIFLAYFVVLAAQPVTSSPRRAGLVAVLAVVEYATLVVFLIGSARLALTASPLVAATAGAVSPLDEGAKMLLLAVAGAIATSATISHERFVLRYSRAQRDSALLEAQLTEAQLQSLKLQLHPHFLFNTLNTITALIGANPRAAERMISGLSDLLRLSLGSAKDQEVPLARELELLDHYLEIERMRFGDRLTVRMRIAPEARAALVPNLVLQPLIENAIRHGIAPRAAPGCIEIAALIAGDRLQLRIADDGVGSRGRPTVDGVGLGNTRARLASLYAGRHRFAAGDHPDGGFAVEIDIPHRRPAPPAPRADSLTEVAS